MAGEGSSSGGFNNVSVSETDLASYQKTFQEKFYKNLIIKTLYDNKE